jgi:hypothetical protein
VALEAAILPENHEPVAHAPFLSMSRTAERDSFRPLLLERQWPRAGLPVAGQDCAAHFIVEANDLRVVSAPPEVCHGESRLEVSMDVAKVCLLAPLRGQEVDALDDAPAGQLALLLAEDVRRVAVYVELEHQSVLVVAKPLDVREDQDRAPFGLASRFLLEDELLIVGMVGPNGWLPPRHLSVGRSRPRGDQDGTVLLDVSGAQHQIKMGIEVVISVIGEDIYRAACGTAWIEDADESHLAT